MALFEELEKLLLEEAIPTREQGNTEDIYEFCPDINFKNPEICLLDITKPTEEIEKDIRKYNALKTNFVILLTNSKNKMWATISTQKPHFIRGHTNCDIEIVKYSGKPSKIQHFSYELDWLSPEESSDDENKPSLPKSKDICKSMLKQLENIVKKGYVKSYKTLDDVKNENEVELDLQKFEKKKIKLTDDPKYNQAINEVAAYLVGIKSKFENKGKKLSSICIEFSLNGWDEERRNPYKSVARKGIQKSSGTVKYNEIDPYGSADGGTFSIELESAKGKQTKELYVTGFDGKPTSELDKNKFKSSACTVYLDSITLISN
ncbi:hypothetical protein HOK51_08150 [Candidatus Woesearchaeota archaeon]|nr:hypothetical protein [Candidatus Woesearchaeota archaeon]MBT6519796.1 hypothetical protein [Candidatus Woesearchaeota archaeon]MBT7368175.1 hypothetical protein [Candidatus Woesearchaeota archaeon]